MFILLSSPIIPLCSLNFGKIIITLEATRTDQLRDIVTLAFKEKLNKSFKILSLFFKQDYRVICIPSYTWKFQMR